MPSLQVPIAQQEDFSAGQFADVAPYLIPDNGVKALIDAFVEEDGAAVERGGTVYKSNKVFGDPTGRVNLLTNPSLETDTAGWGAFPATTMSRVTSQSYVGGASLEVIADGSLNNCGVSAINLAATALTAYTLQARVKGVAGRQYRVRIAESVGGSAVTQTIVTADGTWQLLSVTHTTGAGVTEIDPQVRVNEAIASTFYVDAVQVVQESSASLYFDGDSANGRWNGTPHASASTELIGSMRWIWDGYFDAGQRTVFANTVDFGVLDSDDATPINLGLSGLLTPKPSVLLAGMLFIGGGFIYAGSRKTAPYSTGTVTVTTGSNVVTGSGTTWSTNLDAGMLFQIGNERVYVIASVDSNTQITLRNEVNADGVTVGYEGTGGAGKSYTAHNIYAMTTPDPYEISDFYAVCQNRLLWASGNLFKFSEIGRPHDGTVQIGSASIPDQHELPEGVRITGVAAIGPIALAFTTHGIWTIEGLAFDLVDSQGNTNHRIQRHSGQHILWDGAGVATWEQALVVPCVDGIYLLDGVSQPVQISNPTDEVVMDYVNRGFSLGQAAVYRGHYILPVYSGSGATMRDQMVCRISRPITINGQRVNPWTHFDHHAADLIAFALRVGLTTREPILLGVSNATDARIVECPFFDPAGEVATDANGEIPALDLISKEYPTGSATENVVRSVRTRYELVDAASDDPELRFSYSLNTPISGVPLYDSGLNYDEDVLYVGDIGSLGFTTLDCTGPESNGRTPKRCRINEKTRFFQWRIRNPDPSASCRIRGIDVRIRPSQAVRR
jgi:hypothetical protein